MLFIADTGEMFFFQFQLETAEPRLRTFHYMTRCQSVQEIL